MTWGNHRRINLRPGFFLSRLVFSLVLMSLFSCEFLYEPEKAPAKTRGSETTSTAGLAGTVFAINPGRQICNESISQDTLRFRGCMLWLGFGGRLNVNVPDSMAPGYGSTESAVIHDRLTITDTSNTVRWFIHRDELSIDGQLQDPEWSSHPGYLTALGSNIYNSVWDGYAIRTSDKAGLKINQGKFVEQSTPFLWIADTAQGGTAPAPQFDSRGFPDKASVRSFFGTRRVKIAYALDTDGPLSLHFIDFSETSPVPVKLKKPAGKETWNTESPVISPDGNWVVYNAYENLSYYESYIQALKKGSEPVLIARGASDPRWWTHPSDQTLTYITYTRINGGYFIKQDLTLPELADGSLGSTFKQQVRLFSPDMPLHQAMELIGTPEVLAPLPFKGGLSPDGRYLATGFSYAYLLKLN